jgi:hypothetical protein
MQARGFEYHVIDGLYVSDTSTLGADLEPMEYRRQYGYGVHTLPTPDDIASRRVATDLNEEFREALSVEGREAYDLAFAGMATLDESEAYGRSGGCYDIAWDKVYGELYSDPDQWVEMLDEMDGLNDRARFSSLMIPVNDEWSTCLQERGYPPLESPEGAYSFIEQQGGNSSGLADGVGGNLTDDQNLINLEIELAVADLECQWQVDYETRFNEILFQIEEQFVSTHRGELQQWAEETKSRFESVEGG